MSDPYVLSVLKRVEARHKILGCVCTIDIDMVIYDTNVSYDLVNYGLVSLEAFKYYFPASSNCVRLMCLISACSRNMYGIIKFIMENCNVAYRVQCITKYHIAPLLNRGVSFRTLYKYQDSFFDHNTAIKVKLCEDYWRRRMKVLRKKTPLLPDLVYIVMSYVTYPESTRSVSRLFL
jgi:hypothetical protein